MGPWGPIGSKTLQPNPYTLSMVKKEVLIRVKEAKLRNGL
jgi:hypothetical protein